MGGRGSRRGSRRLRECEKTKLEKSVFEGYVGRGFERHMEAEAREQKSAR